MRKREDCVSVSVCVSFKPVNEMFVNYVCVYITLPLSN